MHILRRLSLAIVFAVIVLTTLNYHLAKAVTSWYVSPTGDNTNDCKTLETPCKTIQAAIDKAASGDYISVASGTYSMATNGESFPVNIDNKALVLAGDASAHPILDGAGIGGAVISAHGSIGVFISNFTMQGARVGITFAGGKQSLAHLGRDL